MVRAAARTQLEPRHFTEEDFLIFCRISVAREMRCRACSQKGHYEYAAPEFHGYLRRRRQSFADRGH